MKTRRAHLLAVLALVWLASPGASPAQPTTMGLLLNTPAAFGGYSLFAPMRYTETYLIDNEGLLIHSWASAHPPGNMGYLLENGNLLRGGRIDGIGDFAVQGGVGLLQEFDWDGNLVWEFLYNTAEHRFHHDIAPLPNGNILMIAWEFKTDVEAIQAGRNPGLLWDEALWPEHIIEIERAGPTGGNIVWEWHVWDHLIQDFDASKPNYGVVEDHPELVDLNFITTGRADWLHANALDYNADLDQIAISINNFNEFWIIDHSTSTAEAAGHSGGARGMGGDILYRWGNPQAYGRGTEANRNNYRQHDVQWIGAGLPGEGNILFYNNGNGRPEGVFSSVEELVTTVDVNGDYPVPGVGLPHGPAAALWVFTATPPESLYSGFISGASRMSNGNTLICEGGSGTFHEVDAAEQLVWQYINPVNNNGPMIQGTVPIANTAFRVHRYDPAYPAFDGRDLTPGEPIELYMTGVEPIVARSAFDLRQNYPNPFRPLTTISFSLRERSPVSLEIHDVGGRRIATIVNGSLGAGEHHYPWHASGVASGVYLYTLNVGSQSTTRRMIVLK